jgi:hypothetical protein
MKMQISFHKKIKSDQREIEKAKALIAQQPFKGKLITPQNTYHTHLSYHRVAVWRIEDQYIKVIYLGSRENAPLLSKNSKGKKIQ